MLGQDSPDGPALLPITLVLTFEKRARRRWQQLRETLPEDPRPRGRQAQSEAVAVVVASPQPSLIVHPCLFSATLIPFDSVPHHAPPPRWHHPSYGLLQARGNLSVTAQASHDRTHVRQDPRPT